MKLEHFKDATRKDLTEVKTTLISGWPERKPQVDPEFREFLNIKEEISVFDGLLLRNDKLIVPSSLREMLSQICSSHLGIDKCKRRARDVLFWPRMN